MCKAPLTVQPAPALNQNQQWTDSSMFISFQGTVPTELSVDLLMFSNPKEYLPPRSKELHYIPRCCHPTEQVTRITSYFGEPGCCCQCNSSKTETWAIKLTTEKHLTLSKKFNTSTSETLLWVTYCRILMGLEGSRGVQWNCMDYIYYTYTRVLSEGIIQQFGNLFGDQALEVLLCGFYCFWSQQGRLLYCFVQYLD